MEGHVLDILLMLGVSSDIFSDLPKIDLGFSQGGT